MRGEKTAEYHDRYAEDRIDEKCLSLEPIPMRNCIHQEIESARNHERSEQDLDAQQAMARFTKVMGYTAILGLAAGIVSIVLIFLTLRATQVMARDTKDIGDAQVSASNAAILVAQDANKVAAQQFRAGFKPWISVDVRGPFIDLTHVNHIRMFDDGEKQRMVPLTAQTFITCIGDIPVTIEDFELLLAEGDAWPYVFNPPKWLGAKNGDFFTILPSKTTIQVDPRLGVGENTTSFNGITLTPENRADFMANPPPVVGRVIYSDPMGVKYEHRFAFVASPAWGHSFKRWGGRERNYEREIG